MRSKVVNNILQSQTHIWNYICSFINTMTLNCAIQLEIPDIINNHDGPITLSELVELLPINKKRSHCLRRLMRFLAHDGFFIISSVSKPDGEEEEGYSLAPGTHLLLKDEPFNIRSFVQFSYNPVMIQTTHHMSEWFGNDDLNTFATAHGRTFWDYLGHNSAFCHLFHDFMARDSRLVTRMLIENCSQMFEDLSSLVDVGGGTGTVAKAISDTFPHLNCINFDLPHVIVGLQGSNNLSHVGGDMFQAIPRADAILLKWILHDWEDEDCIKILTRCKEAIQSKENGGKVIIIDMIVDYEKGDDELIKTQLLYDMMMMAAFTGKERTHKEWAKLFVDAGFSDYKITPLDMRSLIELYP